MAANTHSAYIYAHSYIRIIIIMCVWDCVPGVYRNGALGAPLPKYHIHLSVSSYVYGCGRKLIKTPDYSP